MAEKYFPFDAGAGANVTESQWRDMAQHWLATGVLQGADNELYVYADNTGLQVKVSLGKAWIRGHYYENDAETTLSIGEADPTNPRVDAVVVRADFSENRIFLAVKQGTPGASPSPPPVTQSGGIWEILLAHVRVDAGATSIAQNKITDRRRLVKNANLMTPGLMSNILTNGGFEIWQRGAGAFTTNGAYTADMWYMSFGSGNAMTVQRNDADADGEYSRYCAQVAYTYSNAPGYLRQKVENWRAFRGCYVSLSVRVRTNVPGGVWVGIDIGPAASYSSTSHVGDGTYTTLTVTRYVTNQATKLEAVIMFSATGTYYVDSAMLVAGPTPVPFAPLHPAEGWLRCLRYYERVVDGSQGTWNSGNHYGAASTSASILLGMTEKADVPTITFQGVWSVTNCSGLNAFSNGRNCVRLAATVTNTGVFAIETSSSDDMIIAEVAL